MKNYLNSISKIINIRANRFNHCCVSDCPDGFWGENCNNTCSCPSRSLCDPVTGGCFCPAGLRGRKCRRSCAPGYYGVDCRQVII